MHLLNSFLRFSSSKLFLSASPRHILEKKKFHQNFIFYHPYEPINFYSVGLLKIALIVTLNYFILLFLTTISFITASIQPAKIIFVHSKYEIFLLIMISLYYSIFILVLIFDLLLARKSDNYLYRDKSRNEAKHK